MIPEKIELPAGRSRRIIDVAIGGRHTLLLAEDGTVYGCGSNELGELGLGQDLGNTLVPLEVYGGSIGSAATLVSAGRDHSLIMASDGLYVMGSNEYGQLCADTNGQNVYVHSQFTILQRHPPQRDVLHL